MTLAFSFWDAIWTVIVVFAWVVLFWMIITVLGDLFRRGDIGGGRKTLWCLLVIFLPLIGVLSYLLVNGGGMAERSEKQAAAAQKQAEHYEQMVASARNPADEIARARQLLDSGAITPEEFEQLKAKALA